MNILVIHPGALGDIILSLPALRILRRHFPNALLTLAANLDFAEVVAGGHAEKLVSFSSLPLHHMYGPGAISGEEIRHWRCFDRILSWTGAGHTGAGDEGFAARFAKIHPSVLIRSWKPGKGDRRHVSGIFVESLSPWVPPGETLLPATVEMKPARLEEGRDWLRAQGWPGNRRIFALHPGAGGAAKRWPLDRFRHLAGLLRARGDLLLIEGPAEPGLARELTAGESNTGIYSAAGLPLSLLASVLAHAAAFIGNDSGIAHLAGGLQVASLVLFGPTLPENWSPLGPHVRTLRRAGECRACTGDLDLSHTCLTAISFEEAWHAFESLATRPSYD